MLSTMKPHERRLAALAGLGLALAGLLAFQLLGSSDPVAPPAAPVAAVQPPPTPPAPPAPPPAPAPSADGLRLFGLLGSGAIIAMPDGRQRFVAIGREVVPGLTVA